jgi:GH15 family glucan-1,4-alpha-glucosidase
MTASCCATGPTPTAASTGCPAPRAPSWPACSGWPTPSPASSAGEAERLFERLLDLRNDLGLLSEEYDVRAERQVGNTPQAFSHVGLINVARHLSGSLAAHETGSRARGGN